MQILNEITADPKQKFTVITSAGEEFTLRLNYMPTQSLWFFDVEYKDFAVNNRCLVNNWNLLRQFKNLIPFGIGVICTDEGDPYFVDDFANKRVQLTILSAEEVKEVERIIDSR